MECKWLPPLYAEPDWNSFEDYEKALYEYFCSIYFSKPIFFKTIKVKYRTYSLYEGKQEVYYHLTCRDFNKDMKRNPEACRIIRVSWTRAIIENHDCQDNCCNDKPRYWTEFNLKRKRLRHKLLFRDFLVILEEWDNFFLLISGYYVDEEYQRVGLMKQYKNYCIDNKKTPQ